MKNKYKYYVNVKARCCVKNYICYHMLFLQSSNPVEVCNMCISKGSCGYANRKQMGDSNIGDMTFFAIAWGLTFRKKYAKFFR